MYTLNSTSMRRSQHLLQKQHEEKPLRQVAQASSPHGGIDSTKVLNVPPFAPEFIHGNPLPVPLSTAHSTGVDKKWAPSPVAPKPPPPVGMNTYGAADPLGTSWETTKRAGTNSVSPGVLLRQQRVQEELAQEKLRVQQEIALQQQRLQQQELSLLCLSQRQGDECGLIQQLAKLKQQQQQQQQRTHAPVSSLHHVSRPQFNQQQQSAQLQQHHRQLRQQQSIMTQEGILPLGEQWIDSKAVAHSLPQPSQQQGGVRRGNRDFGLQRQQQIYRNQSMGRKWEPISEAEFGHRTGSGDNRKDSPCGVNGAGTVNHILPSLSDEEILHKFKSLYALQTDDEGGAEHLRAQASTAIGVVGTLDVEKCRKLIRDHDVTIVVTDTGTGKSTLIPKAILDGQPDAKVVNAQPRRTPAIKLAQRVAALYGEKVGRKVGYWVRGEHVGTLGETPIMYVTNYTLFLHLIHNSPNDIGITHVIFDEFHERTTEVEVLLLMMKLVMLRNPGKLRLVLCSATAEVSKWNCFFENLSVAEYSKANAMYPIHDYYLEDVSKLIGMTFVEPSTCPTGVVQSIQLHTIILMLKEMLKFLANTAAPQHSILVFVPGRTVVEQISLWIRNNLGDQLDPIPWYRDIELGFIQEALQRESVTKKKVYVATDIAEVSLTLPDVVFVIDSGTAKRPHIIETNPNSVAFPPLELVWESSVNMLQRRGRIGRVQQGFFFTLLSRKQAQQLSPNESRLGNAVLHEIVLHCLHLTPSPFLMFSLCREKPRKVSVELSLSTLCDGGYIVPEGDCGSLIEAIDNTINHRVKDAWSALIADAYASRKDDNDVLGLPLAQHRFKLSLRGLIVGGLPLGVEPGTIVFSGLIMGLTTLSVIAASCVSCNTPFYVPYNATDKLQRLHLLNEVEKFMRIFKGEYYNDALSAVGAVIAYMAMQREGISEEGQNAWCEERYLSRARITDILLVAKQTREQLAAIVPFEDVTDVDELMEQYNENALTLSFICSAAHMHHGIYVLFDAGVAQKKGYAGSGVFVNINCCRDRSVPTTCPWERDTVCIPFTVQTVYGRLLGSFSSQLKPEVFNIMLLLLSSRFVYEEIYEDAESVTFEVAQSGSCVYINSDRITALQLLQLRRLMCARLCVLHFLMQHEAAPSDNDAIAEHLLRTGSDFGIPPGMEQQPHLLSFMITSSLTKVVQRIGATISTNCDRRVSGVHANSQPFCRVTERPAHFHPTRQSALLFSSNGCAPYECPAGAMTPVYRDPQANLIA
ncbi:ATP-dependent RNA helicase-like protein [Trypanosoma cruzi]|nr:ATP-dependent RNA helicase-like protein [Trypanosoma cruzi]